MDDKQKKALAKFSKKEFQEFILTLMVGVYVRTAVLDLSGNEWLFVEEQLKDILELAQELGHKDLVEKFHDKLLPAEKLCKSEETIIEEFTEIEFWDELELRLGQRDFYNSLTEKELKYLEKQKMLPEKIHEFYQKYSSEFEENGIENLKVIRKKKTTN